MGAQIFQCMFRALEFLFVLFVRMSFPDIAQSLCPKWQEYTFQYLEYKLYGYGHESLTGCSECILFISFSFFIFAETH